MPIDNYRFYLGEVNGRSSNRRTFYAVDEPTRTRQKRRVMSVKGQGIFPRHSLLDPRFWNAESLKARLKGRLGSDSTDYGTPGGLVLTS
jgi:hypothetical protein